MSTINVTNIKGKGGASPNLPDGANVTGVLTATSFVGSGANLTGLANTDFINAEQVTVVGIVTANSYRGDGSSLTGVGESIAPHFYNPDVNDSSVTATTGIGITFNKKVLQGSSGTATLKIVNAGVAGTTIQSWGVSSATYNVTQFNLGALVSNLSVNQTYQLDIPEGFIVDSNETSYAGTAYTFAVQAPIPKLFVWGNNDQGRLGQNQGPGAKYSSPVQIPGTTWDFDSIRPSPQYEVYQAGCVKTDGTLWVWGNNSDHGELGQNNKTDRSSPVQVGSGTDWATVSASYYAFGATKTDGTLYTWGYNGNGGELGHNDKTQRSSPTQVPGTTWSKVSMGRHHSAAIKTDGTLWMWGENQFGNLGQNSGGDRSSPIQVPGTTWREVVEIFNNNIIATKTDNTLWSWGRNQYGELGQNKQGTAGSLSSPTQIPGTNWNEIAGGQDDAMATKTDGTLWVWGRNRIAAFGLNDEISRSSPTQVPGTNWSKIASANYCSAAVKTDGTLWTWGNNNDGNLGHNNVVQYSSPVQVGSLTNWTNVRAVNKIFLANLNDDTP
mgnify:CR=1 FL=1|tara:strand:+ start:702 stop:2360 length:1659 start_codon:yes stop_codon:yes gene_type:complete